MIKKIKKILTNTSIICIVIAAVIGLLLLFKLFSATSLLGSIMLTLLTVFVSSIFLITSVDVLGKNKKFGIFSVSSIAISAILFLIMIWYSAISHNEINGIFFKATVTLAAISLLANLVFSLVLSLGKHLVPVQLLCYLCFIFIETVLLIMAYSGNADILQGIFTTILSAVAIVFVVSYIVLKIKAKGFKEKDNEDYIKITKEEYESLKNRIKELEEKLAKNE